MENKKSYSDNKLQEFKTEIETELQRKKKELTDIRTAIDARKDQLADANLDFNENSQHFQTQAKNESQFRRLSLEVQELESALDRIADKTYGICERTGEKIREARLKAMLTATYDIN